MRCAGTRDRMPSIMPAMTLGTKTRRNRLLARQQA
jgi:hypothetical protein